MDENEAIRASFERLLRISKAYAEPRIIIWGPGPSRAEGYQKRERVRATIQREFTSGKVFFPEDPDFLKLSASFSGSDNVVENELLQAMVVDIIIALDISPAVGEEVARYSAYPKVARKLFVVAPEEHESGYQEMMRNEVCVRFVKTDEMVFCDKTTQLCVEHVNAWCLMKYATAA